MSWFFNFVYSNNSQLGLSELHHFLARQPHFLASASASGALGPHFFGPKSCWEFKVFCMFDWFFLVKKSWIVLLFLCEYERKEDKVLVFVVWFGFLMDEKCSSQLSYVCFLFELFSRYCLFGEKIGMGKKVWWTVRSVLCGPWWMASSKLPFFFSFLFLFQSFLFGLFGFLESWGRRERKWNIWILILYPFFVLAFKEWKSSFQKSNYLSWAMFNGVWVPNVVKSKILEALNIFVSKFSYIFTATNHRILYCLEAEEMEERKEMVTLLLVDEQMNKHEVLN